MAITTATITYTGTLVAGQISSSPWLAQSAMFPDTGAVPNKPKFNLEVLQPPNVDGTRYRVGGAHYPTFRLITVVAAEDFSDATDIAREMEMTQGDVVTVLASSTGTTFTCEVLGVKAVASAKRVIGALGQPIPGGGGAPRGIAQTAMASVDTEWTLQVQSP